MTNRSSLYLKAAISHFNARNKGYVNPSIGICCHLAEVTWGYYGNYDLVTKDTFPELFLFKSKAKYNTFFNAYWVKTQYNGTTDQLIGIGNSYPPLNELRETILLFCHEIAKDEEKRAKSV